MFNLTTRQQQAYDLMVLGKSIFVTGMAGTGKTSVIKTFVKMYKNDRKIAITSTTGTSALLLNGTTLHSFLGIGLGRDSVESICSKIYEYKWLKKRWNQLDCLIIDEISMLNPDLFDKIEEIARIIRDDNRPFGGIQIILSGDFLQLPCVDTDMFCFQAKSWEKCILHTVHLNEIIRQENKIFQSVLNKIRVGDIDDQVISTIDSCIDKNLNNKHNIKPTVLYSKNIDVDRKNEEALNKLAEEEDSQFYEYTMDINIHSSVTNKQHSKQKFLKYCIAPEVLQICVNAQVMLLKNIDVKNGLCNGSRGIVTGFTADDLPIIRFLNGKERIIEYDTWEYAENGKNILKARQLPLKVASALSIHKSQGCSLDYAQIDLSGIFEYGQAYVALSRVKNLNGLSIISVDYDLIQCSPIALSYYKSLK